MTGHCTDYLLSLYTRSVTIGTMVIIDTNQVVNGGGGHQLSNFFLSIITIFSHDTLVSKSNAHDTNLFIEA